MGLEYFNPFLFETTGLGAYFQGVEAVRSFQGAEFTPQKRQESYADYQKRRQEHHEKMEPEAGCLKMTRKNAGGKKEDWKNLPLLPETNSKCTWKWMVPGLFSGANC